MGRRAEKGGGGMSRQGEALVRRGVWWGASPTARLTRCSPRKVQATAVGPKAIRHCSSAP